jgi:GT2 family glycosyltransferase
LRENTGFANAFNFGLALTDGEVILRLDNDAALFPGAAREALEYFEENPRLGMIAPQVRYSSKPELLNATGMKVFWDASAKDEDLCLSIQQAPREYRETVGPPGCVAFIRREVFDKIGPLDPAFFNYFEDVDFALRAQRAGFFCVHIPEIKAEHYGGGAMVNMPSEWKLEMIHRNQARVLVRNFGTWAYIRGLAIFYFRTLTMWRKAKPEYRAHKKAIRFLWKERKSLREQRRVIRSLGPDKNVDKWINRGWL